MKQRVPDTRKMTKMSKARRNTRHLLRPLVKPPQAQLGLVIITITCGIGKFLLPLVIAYGIKEVVDSFSNADFKLLPV